MFVIIVYKKNNEGLKSGLYFTSCELIPVKLEELYKRIDEIYEGCETVYAKFSQNNLTAKSPSLVSLILDNDESFYKYSFSKYTDSEVLKKQINSVMRPPPLFLIEYESKRFEPVPNYVEFIIDLRFSENDIHFKITSRTTSVSKSWFSAGPTFYKNDCIIRKDDCVEQVIQLIKTNMETEIRIHREDSRCAGSMSLAKVLARGELHCIKLIFDEFQINTIGLPMMEQNLVLKNVLLETVNTAIDDFVLRMPLNKDVEPQHHNKKRCLIL